MYIITIIQDNEIVSQKGFDDRDHAEEEFVRLLDSESTTEEDIKKALQKRHYETSDFNYYIKNIPLTRKI